jgi:serine/threonine protein kinase
MGIVYLAKDRSAGVQIVLKLIHPDLVPGEQAVKRLLAEGLTAREIRHPNVVAVYDVTVADGQPYFTMEHVRGRTLRSWLTEQAAANRDVPFEAAVRIVRSMLLGLDEAHRKGVVHRDLKPENVLVTSDPSATDCTIKILDFGIAKAVGTPKTARSGGSASGTPHYMAPEQLTSMDAVRPSADLYALTVMLYEMLMGALPQARLEPIGAHRPDVPAGVDQLIAKGLSTRPRARYQTAAEYSTALDAVVGGRSHDNPNRPGPLPTPVPNQPQPRPFVPQPAPPPQPVGLRTLNARVMNILRSPATEWPAIAAEPSSVAQIMKSYVAPLAAIPAFASLMGLGALGVDDETVLGLTVLGYPLGLLGVYLQALLVEKLAPRFQSSGSRTDAMKLVAYSATPYWIAGVLYMIPQLGLVTFVVSFYSLYLAYIGLPYTMKTPPDRVGAYLVTSVAIVFLILVLTGFILAALGAASVA